MSIGRTINATLDTWRRRRRRRARRAECLARSPAAANLRTICRSCHRFITQTIDRRQRMIAYEQAPISSASRAAPVRIDWCPISLSRNAEQRSRTRAKTTVVTFSLQRRRRNCGSIDHARAQLQNVPIQRHFRRTIADELFERKNLSRRRLGAATIAMIFLTRKRIVRCQTPRARHSMSNIYEAIGGGTAAIGGGTAATGGGGAGDCIDDATKSDTTNAQKCRLQRTTQNTRLIHNKQTTCTHSVANRRRQRACSNRRRQQTHRSMSERYAFAEAYQPRALASVGGAPAASASPSPPTASSNPLSNRS